MVISDEQLAKLLEASPADNKLWPLFGFLLAERNKLARPSVACEPGMW